jgi:hypothetical protein
MMTAMASGKIIDMHAHIYPEGCFAEVVKDRPDFQFVDNPRGQSLSYRGSHVMSMPKDQGDLKRRIASMDDAGIGIAVLSVGALNIGWAGTRDAAAARFINDGLAGGLSAASRAFSLCRGSAVHRCKRNGS